MNIHEQRPGKLTHHIEEPQERQIPDVMMSPEEPLSPELMPEYDPAPLQPGQPGSPTHPNDPRYPDIPQHPDVPIDPISPTEYPPHISPSPFQPLHPYPNTRSAAVIKMEFGKKLIK